MSPTSLDEYRSAARAVSIADTLLATTDMDRTAIAAAMGISEATLRSWRKKPGARISDEAVARKIRKLALRLAAKETARHAGGDESDGSAGHSAGEPEPAPAPGGAK